MEAGRKARRERGMEWSGGEGGCVAIDRGSEDKPVDAEHGLVASVVRNKCRPARAVSAQGCPPMLVLEHAGNLVCSAIFATRLPATAGAGEEPACLAMQRKDV